MAYPPAQNGSGSPIAPTAAQSGPPSPFGAPAPSYSTPSGIPALPRPQLTLSKDDLAAWQKRVTDDRARRELEKGKWRTLISAYYPPKFGSDWTDLNSNIHFRNVELKSAEMWSQLPEIILTPRDPLKGIPAVDATGQPIIDPQTQQPQMANPDDVIAIRRAILNKELGRDGANADLMMKYAMFYVFMASGVGPSKICYEADVKYIEPTPAQQPGAILGLSGPTPQQPVVVNERRRWYHFSPDRLLIPVSFLSTDWDHAPYLGMEFEEADTPQARRAYNLPDDFNATTASTDRPLSSDLDRASQTTRKVIKGVEIWLHAADFDPNEPDKDVFYRLVLVDGMKDRPAVYEFSPYQDKDLRGRLTSDSMIGNPIHPFTFRVAGDTAWVPSDAAFTNPLVNIENIQERRDALIAESNIPRFLHAASITQAIDKMRDASTGQGAAIDDALLARGIGNLIAPLPHLERAESDKEGREHIRQAITETLGIGANQAGSFSSTRKSATEVATVEANVNARLQGERLVLLSRFMAGVRKFDTLITRYMTDAGYVQIAGQDGAHRLMAYNKAHLAPRFSYDAFPDSQLTVDAATRKKSAMDYVNFMAKSPFTNQQGVARMISNAFGYDTQQTIQTPPPPPPAPPPNATIQINPQFFAIPEYRAVLSVLYPELKAVLGAPPSPEAQLAGMAAETKGQHALVHGGSMPKADTVDKHEADQTGNQKGPAPLGGVPPAQPVPGGRMIQ